jgi:hypothetical protein
VIKPQKEYDARDRKLTLAVAIEKLRAVRDPNDETRWAYYAEETESWWSVTPDSLLCFVEALDRHTGGAGARKIAAATKAAYEEWAEADDTAIERGRRL